MNKIFYLIKKPLANIIGRPLSALTSLLSLLLLMLMFDLVWISSLTVDNYLENITTDIDMEIYLDDSLPDSTVAVVMEAVTAPDGIAKAVYISREDARDKLHSLMGTDLLAGFGENPLPRSIIVTFIPEYLNSSYLAELTSSLERLQGVSEIYYPGDWLEKIEGTHSLLLKIVIFLGIVISLAVVLNLLYTIRLSARSRGQELIQHRLLGAGKIFLSFPYIVEGIIYSLAAAAAGWLIIYYASMRLTFTSIEIVFPARLEIIYFCLTALLVGLAGGYIGIRRSLR